MTCQPVNVGMVLPSHHATASSSNCLQNTSPLSLQYVSRWHGHGYWHGAKVHSLYPGFRSKQVPLVPLSKQGLSTFPLTSLRPPGCSSHPFALTFHRVVVLVELFGLFQRLSLFWSNILAYIFCCRRQIIRAFENYGGFTSGH